VEATKYTEVGYVGRDVESMIRDLMHVAVNMVRSELQEEVRAEAERRAEETLLDLLLPGSRPKNELNLGSIFGAKPANDGPAAADGQPGQGGQGQNLFGINLGQLQATLAGQVHPAPGAKPAEPVAEEEGEVEKSSRNETREKFRQMLRDGKLEDKEVEIQVSQTGGPAIEVFSGGNLEEIDLNLGNLGNLFSGKKKKKSVRVRVARGNLIQEEMAKLVDSDRVAEIARDRAENMGIIFVDEIDKIASRGANKSGADVSREGVQRDILPIVEGCQVNTKYGLVDTRHILFIAAGAFHMSKPSDLIPELQGRFPIRVELEPLGEDDFLRILTQPANSITRQYTELLKTEGVAIDFQEDALKRLARIAAEVNGKTENIGARRLHTIMELLLEEVSFHAPDMKGQTVPITASYVDQRLGAVVQDQDLSRYIL
jgi:ATP-dependent HslUV protease ATP-binding subunit HslU